MTEFLRYLRRHADPEMLCGLAPMPAYCGPPEAALEFLERGVERRFGAMAGNPEFFRISS